MEEGIICSSLGGREEDICRVADLQLAGAHNIENALAAAGIALLAGCAVDAVGRGLRDFRGLEHVMEKVRVLRGVTYINDSKGTNADATIKALESQGAPVVLIAGGREKGGDYPGLASAVRRTAKRLVLLGEARSHLKRLLEGACPIMEVENLAEAVLAASAAAAPGDTVLFSPACASFDMFVDYKDRGRRFKELVHELE